MNYEAFPANFQARNAATIAKVHRLFDRALRHETFFSDFQKGCDEACGECEKCLEAKRLIAQSLLDPSGLVWEVWQRDPLDFVGILKLGKINPGCDATAHYFFFDGKLRDKTELLNDVIHWAFTSHDGWIALKRITVEIPSDAFALARHAYKHLGFGGSYEWRERGVSLPIEGVRREAIRRDGRWLDVLLMGRLNELYE